MTIMNAEFVLSAAHFIELPAAAGKEFCLMGRSNVGKSSFINHVLSKKGLARVSNKPGKTTLANFFKVSDGSMWVDLPGYGYARTARAERARWDKLIEEYCEKRENLCGVIWLLDVRHVGLEIDVEAGKWLERLSLPTLPVLTKCDKLTRSELAAQKKAFIKTLGLSFEPLAYSINDISYRDKFWEYYRQWQSQGFTP